MKHLKYKIAVLALFVLQSVLMIFALYILKDLFLDIINKSLISQQEKMFLLASIFIMAIISAVLVLISFRISAKQEKIIVEIPIEGKIDEGTKKKKRNEEEQRRLSEVEKMRNKAINSLMNGLNDKLDIKTYSEKILSNLSKHYELVQGMVFMRNDENVFKKSGTYAYYSEEEVKEFKEGVGITGQVAINKELLSISNIPEKYLTVLSGLGSSSPANLVIFPIIFDNRAVGIIEIATFVKMDKLAHQVLMVLSRKLGEHINQIKTPEKVK